MADISAGRLDEATLEENFGDLHPPLDPHEAMVAADRCYFCYDAPCVTACPTGIDVPLFIRQIASGMPEAAAKTIFDQNILGGMCARVCPTETLCEQACVREEAEGQPVDIGQLQRYATDELMAASMNTGEHPYTRAKDSGKHVAVVGAGPAGLACAHRLAMHGHKVTIMEKREKGAGLNEYGIAAYKTVDDFAQAELDWLLSIGGIALKTGVALGQDVTLDQLKADHDAVFIGIGKSAAKALPLPQTKIAGSPEPLDAIDFIASLRQADPVSDVAVGNNVVVIGGGMTAIDAGVQSKLLGAETVTVAYRGPQDRMSASDFEQDLAATNGVHLLFDATPKSITTTGVAFERADGSMSEIAADQVMVAIGQEHGDDAAGINAGGNVFAGGDFTAEGEDLTVTAVAQGRDAAEAIHGMLGGG